MLRDSNNDLSAKQDKRPYVALTIDGWSSRRQLSMISLVVYFILENGGTIASHFSKEVTRENGSLNVHNYLHKNGILKTKSFVLAPIMQPIFKRF